MNKKRKYDERKLQWLKDGKSFLFILLAAVVVFRFVIGLSIVDGHSMEPTLSNGQPVLYSRVSGNYNTGDIVSLKMPGGSYYIKRIVATEGDVVEIKDGTLWVNGSPQPEYGSGVTAAQGQNVKYPLKITEGFVFAVGDNREGSIDCRTFGPAAVSQIRGKIIFIS